jgi:non-specific serine/threonine protein kinase/serine/threonine-protein kinase
MIKDLPGSTPARKVLVERALHYLDSLSREARGDSRLEAELASAYERLGDVQGNPRSTNLGDTAGALASFRKALALRESLATQQPGSFQAQRARWSVVYRISSCLDALGRYVETAGFYRRELPTAEEYARGRKEAEIQEWLAGAYFSTADSMEENGDLDEALRYYRMSASIREVISRPDGPLEIRTRLVGSYGATAYVLFLQREYPRAVETERKAVTASEDLAARYLGNATILRFRGQAHFFWASSLADRVAGARRSPRITKPRRSTKL